MYIFIYNKRREKQTLKYIATKKLELQSSLTGRSITYITESGHNGAIYDLVIAMILVQGHLEGVVMVVIVLVHLLGHMLRWWRRGAKEIVLVPTIVCSSSSPSAPSQANQCNNKHSTNCRTYNDDNFGGARRHGTSRVLRLSSRSGCNRRGGYNKRRRGNRYNGGSGHNR